MEITLFILVAVVLVIAAYFMGRKFSPVDNNSAAQQELIAAKVRLDESEKRRKDERMILENERNLAQARASAAENNLAAANEAKASAERTLEQTRESISQLEVRMREAFASAAQAQISQSRTDFIGMAEQKFAPFKTQLEELNRTNNELKGSLTTNNERSEKVAEEARKLAAAMTSTNKQGSWGELQLNRVAELTGMLQHVDFVTQESRTNEEGNQRPDMVVKLHGGRQIIIDAKAPTKNYIEATSATNEADRARLLQQFASKIREHAKRLGEKEYWNQYKPAPEFVILFLPSEALFSAALQIDPDLIEAAWGEKVVIATPTTLLSILRTISHTWDRVDVEKRAEKVVELAEKIIDGLRVASDHFEDTGKKLNQAVDSYNSTLGTLQSRVYSNANKLITEGGKLNEDRQIAQGEVIDIQAKTSLEAAKITRKRSAKELGDVEPAAE
jgi:DNA recombination protein RmuC